MALASWALAPLLVLLCHGVSVTFNHARLCGHQFAPFTCTSRTHSGGRDGMCKGYSFVFVSRANKKLDSLRARRLFLLRQALLLVLLYRVVIVLFTRARLCGHQLFSPSTCAIRTQGSGGVCKGYFFIRLTCAFPACVHIHSYRILGSGSSLGLVVSCGNCLPARAFMATNRRLRAHFGRTVVVLWHRLFSCKGYCFYSAHFIRAPKLMLHPACAIYRCATIV